MASTIASIPGASAVLKGGIVTYDQNVKIGILRVSPETLSKYTAESQETTNEMCIGLKHLYPCASIHVAVTGVASEPEPGTYVVNKKEGQIYVSVFYKELKKFNDIIESVETDKTERRNDIRAKTVAYIFDRIEEIIAETPSQI